MAARAVGERIASQSEVIRAIVSGYSPCCGVHSQPWCEMGLSSLNSFAYLRDPQSMAIRLFVNGSTGSRRICCKFFRDDIEDEGHGIGLREGGMYGGRRAPAGRVRRTGRGACPSSWSRGPAGRRGSAPR